MYRNEHSPKGYPGGKIILPDSGTSDLQYIILGECRPSILMEPFIRKEIERFLGQYGLHFAYCDVRNPEYCAFIARDVPARKFHQDNCMQRMWMACWASARPTEFRSIKPVVRIATELKPWEVIVFDNRTVEHRMPSGITKKIDRWFARCIGVFSRTPYGTPYGNRNKHALKPAGANYTTAIPSIYRGKTQ